MSQLEKFLPQWYTSGEGINILLRAPSGWGKTRMALQICNYMSGGNFNMCVGNRVDFREKFHVHFLDEIHLVENPEFLYPYMDSGKYFIVMATNERSILTEALVNRCQMDFIFTDYSKPELRDITRTFLRGKLPADQMDYLIDSCGGNPRIIKNMSYKLNILSDDFSGLSLDKFKKLLEELFGIKDGMDILCQRYMEALSSMGGRGSISTLSAYLHVDEGTLKFYVEPVLLYKNLIQITSRGRSIVKQ